MTTQVRYAFNGLYCPRAKDFLPPQEELVRVPEFLEACCKRLERLFPDVPHVASLVKEMRGFAKNNAVIELDGDEGVLSQRIDTLEDENGELKEQVECLQMEVRYALPPFDDTLPE